VTSEEGTSFGRYRLLERLAVGGMAELYRAVIPGPSGFSKIVAIKKILPALNKHSRFRKMFRHEGRIMAALDHRNIVQVFELGEVEGELFMCQEFVSGCDLARVLSLNKMSGSFMDPYMAAWISRELCRGLDYVHNLNDDQGNPLHVVHRDVNPHNILISRHGDVKLGDFGIAKSLVGEVVTSQGQLKGKLEYLSPEQARGDEAGPASDVYAVGLVLYEALSSQRYIQGISHADFLRNAARPLWRPISKNNPAVPARLEEIVKRAVRTEPEKRFAAASAFADQLTQFIETASRIPSSSDLAELVTSIIDEKEETEQAVDQDDTDTEPEMDGNQNYPASPVLEIDEVRLHAAPDDLHTRTMSLVEDDVSDSHLSKFTNARKALALTGLAGVVLTVVLLIIHFSSPSSSVDQKTTFPELPKPSEGDHLVLEPIVVDAQPEKEEEPIDAPGENDGILGDTTPDAQPDRSRVRPKKRRKIRRTKRRRKKAFPKAAETTLAHQPDKADPAGDQTPPSAQALKAELGRQRRRLQDKGIRVGDARTIDAVLARLTRQIGKNQLLTAQEDMQALDRAIDNLVIDREFVEKKLKRLERTLKKKKLEARFTEPIREILNHAINNRFTEANSAINRLFDTLRKLSRT
jgi:serine/threonine protein kinase